MNNSIALANDWATMKEQASALVRSGLLPKAIDTPEKAIAIMMQGRELGIGPMQAIAGINVIAGKATVSPQLMLALIERSGKLEHIDIDSQQTYCTVTMKRIGRHEHSETFTMDDASRMMTSGWKNNKKVQIPLSEKSNWQQMPAIMLKWRAVAACARVVFPDVIMGMYTHEEIDPSVVVDADGDMIDGNYKDAASHALGLGYGESDATAQEGALIDEPRQHWTATQDWKRFYTYTTRNLGLSHDEVHEALDVDSAKKFQGTKEEAFNKLNEYAVAKSEAASGAVESMSEEMSPDEYTDGLQPLDGFNDEDDAIAAIRGA
jgi:hypothetical protein